MDRVLQMQVFTAVAEEEGFAAAARKLAMSPPVVTRTISELETRLGIKLFNRTTRIVRTTDAGKRYLEDTKRILELITEAEDCAAGINATPSGRLNITAPVLFGRLFINPSITEYLNAFPDMSVNAMFLDRVVDLLDEDIDVGIRIGKLPDSSLHARQIGQVRYIVCASPDYLKQHGTPRQPKALTKHQIVCSNTVSQSTNWRFKDGESVKLKPRLVMNSNDAIISATKDGFGITRLISYQVAPQIEDGSLKIVLKKYEPEPMPINIVYREGRHSSAKIRSFIDLVSENLQRNGAIQ